MKIWSLVEYFIISIDNFIAWEEERRRWTNGRDRGEEFGANVTFRQDLKASRAGYNNTFRNLTWTPRSLGKNAFRDNRCASVLRRWHPHVTSPCLLLPNGPMDRVLGLLELLSSCNSCLLLLCSDSNIGYTIVGTNVEPHLSTSINQVILTHTLRSGAQILLFLISSIVQSLKDLYYREMRTVCWPLNYIEVAL